MNAIIDVFNGMYNNVHELHAGNHKINFEDLIVDKHIEQRFKTLSFADNFFEIVKGTENDFVSTLNKTNGSEQF